MYTVKEAAKLLNLDTSHIRSLLRSGKLRGVKWGRDWMIPVLDYQSKPGGSDVDAIRDLGPPEITSSNESEILHFLEQTPVLKRVKTAKLRKIASTGTRLHFAKNQMIVMEAEKAGYCFFVLNGLVKVFKTSHSGRELIIDLLDHGKVFGISSLFPDHINTGGVQALKSTDLIGIPINVFSDFMASNPEVMSIIVELEIDRIEALFSKLIELLANKTDHRVIIALNDLRSKFGDKLPFTHKEIGEICGATNETVTRILARLKEKGILQLHRGFIQVTDGNRLAAYN